MIIFGVPFSQAVVVMEQNDHLTQPALKAVSCTDIATGAGGHRYGLCQMGAALRAKNGDSASNILLYYYTDCRIISCTIKIENVPERD